MRIQGRILRPQNLAERRVLKSLGVDFIRCPRRHNPFAIARLIRRTSFGGGDMPKLRTMLKPRSTPTPITPTLPDSQSAPVDERAT